MTLLFPGQRGAARLSIAAMEAENFAWIDFFWSTLGRSGEVGTDIGLIYADLSSAADLNLLSGNLIHGLFRGATVLTGCDRSSRRSSRLFPSTRSGIWPAASGVLRVTLSPKARPGCALPGRALRAR